MKLLINESPLQVFPALAMKVGLNEAIFLQQLHFRLLISIYMRDGHTYFYKTYEEWKGEMPFWSTATIKRIIRGLEIGGYVLSNDSYNRMTNDKMKWYRIDQPKNQLLTAQNDPSNGSECTHEEGQSAPSSEVNLTLPITKDLKRIKKETVGQDPDVVSILYYLNESPTSNLKPLENIAVTHIIVFGTFSP